PPPCMLLPTLPTLFSLSFYSQRSPPHRALLSFPTRRSSDLGLQHRPTTDRGAVDFAHVQSCWTSYPGVQIFEQSRTEEMLSSALAAEGRPVRWGHRLVALHEGAEEAEDRKSVV